MKTKFYYLLKKEREQIKQDFNINKELGYSYYEKKLRRLYHER